MPTAMPATLHQRRPTGCHDGQFVTASAHPPHRVEQQPHGRKEHVRHECSPNPHATNADAAGCRFLVGDGARENPIHTARHTRGWHDALEEQRRPIGATCPHTLTKASPTAPVMAATFAKWTSASATSAPARLPSHTSSQLPSRASVDAARRFRAHTRSTLPVNSSAPQHSTSTSPR